MKGNDSNKLNCLLHHETTGYCSIENTHLGLHLHLDQKKTAIATKSTSYLGHLTTKKNVYSNETIFLGAAGNRATPTMGVLGTHETSRPYKWHSRGGR